MKKLIILNAQPGGNKGAEAMLETLIREVLSSDKNFDIYLEKLNNSDAYETFRKRIGIDINFVLFKPKNIFKPYDLKLQKGDVVVDIGGINYHDGSNKANLRNFIRHRFFIKQNANVIFFTQDFGPAKRVITSTLAKYVYSKAKAVFSRSQLSFDMLKKLVPKANVLGPYPDCTFLLEPSHVENELIPENYFVVSPSAIMFNKHGQEYLNQLSLAIRSLSKDITPLLVVHNFTPNGISSDYKVAHLLHGELLKLGVQSRILDIELAPSQFKFLFSNAKFSLTSRYHVVVGSLSCGTPSIAIGWSHKYQEFLSLYGLEYLNLKASETLGAEITAVANKLLFEESLLSVQKNNESIKSRVKESFKQLLDLLE